MKINELADIDGYLSRLSCSNGLLHFQQQLAQFERRLLESPDEQQGCSAIKSLLNSPVQRDEIDAIVSQYLALSSPLAQYFELCLIDALMRDAGNDDALQLLLALYQQEILVSAVNGRLCRLAEALVSVNGASLQHCHAAMSLLMFVESLQSTALQQQVCSLVDVAMALHPDDKPLQTLVTIIRTLVLADMPHVSSEAASEGVASSVAKPAIALDQNTMAWQQTMADAMKRR